MNWTLATIEWGLPHNDNTVKWELWTSSNDASLVKFKQNFKDISLLLGSNNFTIFEPRMYIDGSEEGPCGNSCTNGCKYCTYSQYNQKHGISGVAVIQENVRNLCVWNYTKHSDTLQHNLNESSWWDYAIMWDLNCAFPSNNSKIRFTQACSYDQMDLIDPSNGLKNYVKQCVIDSGGYGRNDVNLILQDQVELRDRYGIHSKPTVRVNEFLVGTSIDCNVTSPNHCPVLAAICSGFINGTQPDICYGTHNPSVVPTLAPSLAPTLAPSLTPTLTPSFAPSLACDNGKHWDKCGQCITIADPSFDYCVGCDGIPYSDSILDCMGICNGSHKLKCGICLNSSNIVQWKGFNCSDNESDNNESTKNESYTEKSIILYCIIGAGSWITILVLIISCRYCKLKKQQQNLQKELKQIIIDEEQSEDH